ncbi:MAG: adenine phosphoribosyltransferase [Euryarchaeota archaeon]|nr:adenine phosphoribosyltransferase [Euryarchaeota archaeon]
MNPPPVSLDVAPKEADPAMVYPQLVRSLVGVPIMPRGDYDYFVHPLADGIPLVRPNLVREAAKGLATHLGPVLDDIKKLVTAEAMGLPLVTALGLETGLPYVVARKRSYGLPGEQALHQTTGYSAGTLWLNGIEPGDRVAIVDDVISTGGTLRALVDGIRNREAEVLSIVSVFSKDSDLDSMADALGCPVSALVSCRVVPDGDGKRVEVLGIDVGQPPRS